MARRHSAPETDLHRLLEPQHHYHSKTGMDSLGCVMSSSFRELSSASPMPDPVPRLLEIVVSQGTCARSSRPPPPRHRSPLTNDIDEYVSEILVESLHWLGDQLESVSNALGGSVNVLEKEIKVRLQNTAGNTVVHLNPMSNHQIVSISEDHYAKESERVHERASSLHRLHQLFEEAKEAGSESPEYEGIRAASPAGSFVDSLDEPAPCQQTAPFTINAISTLTSLPTHTDKSKAFFIRIDDGSCEHDQVIVADHMPEKIRRSLNQRKRKREMRIERARRMRNRGEKDKTALVPNCHRHRQADMIDQETRRECTSVLQALVEAVAAVVAAGTPEPPNRRRSRIPVRVAERPWNQVFAAPSMDHKAGTLHRRGHPRAPHVALLLTPQPLASCS